MADSRPKMLLFQSCITDGVNDDGDCAREWRSQGVAVDCVRLRTGAHLDFRRRELFHAVAGMLDAFVEAREAPAGLVERLECLEFDTDGGLAFRLVADEKAPDAEAVRGLIARKNFRDDDDLQKHVLGAIKRAGDPALSLDYAQTSVALWPHDPQSHARLGETLAKVGDAANARKAFLAAVDLAPEVESYRKALADVSE
jgi:hypothetical protein